MNRHCLMSHLALSKRWVDHLGNSDILMDSIKLNGNRSRFSKEKCYQITFEECSQLFTHGQEASTWRVLIPLREKQ